MTAIENLASADELEAALRRIGADRYHNLHPFHRLLHGGALSQGQVQAWALNRYYYQSRIPLKDAALISRCTDRELRREWLVRVLDHDGQGEQEGGIVRWLRLCEGLGLDPVYVRSEAGILPATRFAVDAYVRFVREQSLLEAVASSLTELFAPGIHQERIPGMLKGYAFVTDAMMGYFRRRLDQAPRDAGFALAYVRDHADTAEKRAAVCRALMFKCDVLWSQLDALHHAYVLGGGVPPGAFVPARASGEGGMSTVLDETRAASLPPWVRLRFDKVRARWVLLAPERVLFPCETSVEILNLLPEAATLGALIDRLAADYDAPREAIAADVQAMLGDLAAQGFLTQPAEANHV